jgi:hypothetical protein
MNEYCDVEVRIQLQFHLQVKHFKIELLIEHPNQRLLFEDLKYFHFSVFVFMY